MPGLDWLDEAFGVGDEAEPVAPAPRPAKIESCFVVTAQPSGAPGDRGETVECFYLVDGDHVTLCSCDGKVADDAKRARLAPGDSPKKIATRLRRAQYFAENPNGDFNRRLNYGPMGIA